MTASYRPTGSFIGPGPPFIELLDTAALAGVSWARLLLRFRDFMRAHLLTYRNTPSRIGWHVAFWFVLVSYHWLVFGTYSGNFERELMWELVALPAKMAAAYVTMYILLPRTLLRHRLVSFLFAVTLVVLVAALFQRLLELAVVREFSNPFERSAVLLHPVKVLRAAIGIYPVVALATLIKLGKSWLRKDLLAEQMAREKLEAEMKFLRSQIQPHFLFNTLNNLYALTLKKSSKAPEAVLWLSDLLGYLLYEGNKPMVPLEQEVDIVRTYMELEKLRYGDRLDATVSISGDVSSTNIAPLIILPLVENAFKHGIGKQLGRGMIRVDLEVKDQVLDLRVQNSVPARAPGHEPDSGAGAAARAPEPGLAAGGIGLANVRRRLDLIYGNIHVLDIETASGLFTVRLQLDSKHQPAPVPS